MNTPIRIAVLSFAHTHARTYIQLLRTYPNVELLTTDPDGPSDDDRGRALADQLGVAYVDSYEEALAWKPDGVIVASENARHRELVEMSAAAGADILCEKPLATTYEDGIAIQQAVAAASVRLMVAFPVRFASTFASMKAAHDSGALGEIVSFRASNNGKLPVERDWFTDPTLSGGGALVDHVVHAADLIEALTGAEPVAVTAVANRTLHADRAQAETAGLVTISYADGSIAAVDCSWSQPESAPTWGGLRFVVTGTEGTIDVDFFKPRVRGLDADSGRPIEVPYGPNFNDGLLRAFIDSIRNGTQAQPDVHVGMKTLQIVLAAQESARTGQTVSVRALERAS